MVMNLAYIIKGVSTVDKCKALMYQIANEILHHGVYTLHQLRDLMYLLTCMSVIRNETRIRGQT